MTSYRRPSVCVAMCNLRRSACPVLQLFQTIEWPPLTSSREYRRYIVTWSPLYLTVSFLGITIGPPLNRYDRRLSLDYKRTMLTWTPPLLTFSIDNHRNTVDQIWWSISIWLQYDYNLLAITMVNSTFNIAKYKTTSEQIWQSVSIYFHGTVVP